MNNNNNNLPFLLYFILAFLLFPLDIHLLLQLPYTYRLEILKFLELEGVLPNRAVLYPEDRSRVASTTNTLRFSLHHL